MAGEIKLNSVNFASESGGTITVNNGTLGSAVAMSANQACVKTALNALGSAGIYACRAFGRAGTGSAHSNFVGQNLSYSKSSSNHTFTFSIPPTNDDYTVVGLAARYGSYSWLVCISAKSTNSFTLVLGNTDGTLMNASNEGVEVAVFF